jgi:hypothetical protein
MTDVGDLSYRNLPNIWYECQMRRTDLKHPVDATHDDVLFGCSLTDTANLADISNSLASIAKSLHLLAKPQRDEIEQEKSKKEEADRQEGEVWWMRVNRIEHIIDRVDLDKITSPTGSEDAAEEVRSAITRKLRGWARLAVGNRNTRKRDLDHIRFYLKRSPEEWCNREFLLLLPGIGPARAAAFMGS